MSTGRCIGGAAMLWLAAVAQSVAAQSAVAHLAAAQPGAAQPAVAHLAEAQPGAAQPATARELVVCADPNNLPFSNDRRAGFENHVVEMIARDLGRPVRYVWWAQRRGYARNTVNASKCDLWPGVATGIEMLQTTAPYYRSSYVFVTRADRSLRGLTLDDDRLRTLSIGVQMIGDDANNTPPAHAVARRGLIQNARGYMVYGDYARANPSAAIIDAVARGEIDVAIAWGPLAGYFSKDARIALRVEPVTPAVDEGRWPMTFAISMGVRKDDRVLAQQLDAALHEEQPAIRGILGEYGVPLQSP